jgi:hypothetical protein
MSYWLAIGPADNWEIGVKPRQQNLWLHSGSGNAPSV